MEIFSLRHFEIHNDLRFVAFFNMATFFCAKNVIFTAKFIVLIFNTCLCLRQNLSEKTQKIGITRIAGQPATFVR